MQRINLTYTVEVNVEVDLNDGRITKVSVDDESLSDTVQGSFSMDEPGFTLELDDPRVLAAHRIVASSDEWPAWGFGF